MADRGERKVKITLSVRPATAKFLDVHGGAKKTDLTVGKVNVSEEVDRFIEHDLMSKVSPEVVGWALAREKEEHRLAMEDVDRRARDLFGTATIDEWVAREQEGQRLDADLVQAQVALRTQIKDDKLRELQDLWSRYHAQGHRPSRTNEIAWAKGHVKELRLLDMTPEEFVARMGRARDSPEVR